jgi:AbrB family looped-hinge helix DNA binding protein
MEEWLAITAIARNDLLHASAKFVAREREPTTVVKLSSKGQLVLPKAVCQALKLDPGAEFDVRISEGRIILEPVTTAPVSALYGKYAGVDFLADLEAKHCSEVHDDAALRA